MAQALTAPMPPDLILIPASTVRLTAIDPATGSVVSGVNVSDVIITGQALAAPADLNPPGPVSIEWLNLEQPDAAPAEGG